MSATAWAESVPGDKAVRWKALEVAAFAAYPKVTRVLDPKRKYGRPKEGIAGAVKTIVVFPALLAWMVVMMFPAAVGAVFILLSNYQPSFKLTSDPLIGMHFALSAAGIAFLWSIVVQVGWWIHDGWHGKAREFPSVARGAVGIGIVALVVVLFGRHTPVGDLRHLCLAAIVGSTLLGVVRFVVYVCTIRTKRSGESAASSHTDAATSKDERRHTTAEPLKAVRLAVEKLPQKDRDAVRDDIDSAVGILASRGIITDADADWARSAELGKLALHMSSPRSRR